MGQKVQNLQSRKLERVLFTDESLKFTAEIGLRFSEPFHSSLHSTFRHSYLCSNLLLWLTFVNGSNNLSSSPILHNPLHMRVED
jgi:hypothetical protein